MLKVTLQEALSPDCPSLDVDYHDLYIVTEPPTVFYVGMTTDHPLNRLSDHCGLGPRQWLPDRLGEFIHRNHPQSAGWEFHMLTIADAISLAPSVFPPDRTYGARTAERRLIAFLRPCLNIMLNPDPTPLPERYRGGEYDPRPTESSARYLPI